MTNIISRSDFNQNTSLVPTIGLPFIIESSDVSEFPGIKPSMLKKERLAILLFAMLCLLSGLWSGLNRIGWDIAILPISPHHGAIMVGGFLGTLIALEKIIPLKKKSLYLIPVLNALSVVFFFSGQPKLSIHVLVISSTSLSFLFLYYFRKQRTIIYVLMLLGSICWLTGNILLLTNFFYPLAFPWWAAFALFIIAAERLELMKFLPVSQLSKNILVLLLLCFIIGVLLSFHGTGNLICGCDNSYLEWNHLCDRPGITCSVVR